MAWSNPRTWVAGELVTAAMMNAHVRDQFDFWAATPHELQVSRSTNQSIPNATDTLITWNSEQRDVGFGFSPTSGTITVQQSGIYTVSLTTQWDGVASSGCGVEIRITGLTTTARAGHGGYCPVNNEGNQKNCAVTQRIEAGQTIQARCFQSTGAAADLQSSGAAGTRLTVVQVNRSLIV